MRGLAKKKLKKEYVFNLKMNLNRKTHDLGEDEHEWISLLLLSTKKIGLESKDNTEIYQSVIFLSYLSK